MLAFVLVFAYLGLPLAIVWYLVWLFKVFDFSFEADVVKVERAMKASAKEHSENIMELDEEFNKMMTATIEKTKEDINDKQAEIDSILSRLSGLSVNSSEFKLLRNKMRILKEEQ